MGETAARVSDLDPETPLVRRSLYTGIALMLVLGVAVAAVSVIAEFPDVDLRLRPLPLALSAIGMALSLMLAAEVWRRLLRALGPEIVPAQGQAIWFTSVLGRYVPTGTLMPVLRVALASRAGVPKRICLASGVYEAALFFVANLIIGAYLLVELPGIRDEPERYLLLLLPFAALIVLHPRIFHPLADGVLRRFGRAPLPVSLPVLRVLEFLGLYLFVAALGGLSTYGLAVLLYPIGPDDLFVVAASFAVGTVLSILAFIAPGGLVAREAGVALTVGQVMPAGPALAFAIGSRILQLALEVGLAVVWPVVVRRRAGNDASGG